MAEPFSDEAMLFTKELVLQREVSGSAGPLWPPSHQFDVLFFFFLFSLFHTGYFVLASFQFHTSQSKFELLQATFLLHEREKNGVHYLSNSG